MSSRAQDHPKVVTRRTRWLPSSEVNDNVGELSIRTDIALEAQEAAVQRVRDVPGVLTETETYDTATLTRTMVESSLGAELIGKPQGTYIVIETDGLTGHDHEAEVDLSRLVAREIQGLLTGAGVEEGQLVLVVGLGNWNATPDNVGPLTVSKLLVTRHLHEYRVLDDDFLTKMRPVAALSPGVLGLTGMESAEMVKALVEAMQPAAVVCVDALAAASIDRVGKTIQLSDAGIHPGSGVGNVRRGLTRDTLGVPVVVVGVPTVIYATTIVQDALALLKKEEGSLTSNLTVDPALLMPSGQAPGAQGGNTGDGVGGSSVSSSGRFMARTEEDAAFVRRVLGDSMGTLIVTPKEIDMLVDTISDVIADGINDALHPGISAEEARALR